MDNLFKLRSITAVCLVLMLSSAAIAHNASSDSHAHHANQGHDEQASPKADSTDREDESQAEEARQEANDLLENIGDETLDIQLSPITP